MRFKTAAQSIATEERIREAPTKIRIILAAAAATLTLSSTAHAQAQNPPPPQTIKVDGTDNVYIFRYRGYQSMFVVTPQGVIATDPAGRYKPEAAPAYIAEIKKITNQPIKYLIYSHSHFDHIAGGKPFKDAGARIIAHKNARDRFVALKKVGVLLDSVVIPDEVVTDKKTISLGGTTLELLYVGRNHSDSSLIMRLPKEKLIFAVDLLPIEGFQYRNMPDYPSPLELEESIKRIIALDWDRFIGGHPAAGGRLGTKKDAQDDLAYLQELSAEVKKAADAGKCPDTAMKEIKLPKYEKWNNYETVLPMNIERYCYWWSQGY